MSDETELDVTDLDRYMGVPMEPGLLKEPVATNDIRRWVQAMHYPNPLHSDEHWAAASRFGDLVAPQSFTVACDTSHGCSPAQVGKIPDSHLIFGGDDWWFFGPRIWPGDHLICHRMPYDYRVTETRFAGPTCFQRGDTLSCRRGSWPRPCTWSMKASLRSSRAASSSSVHVGSPGSAKSFFSLAFRGRYRMAVERWRATRSPRWLT